MDHIAKYKPRPVNEWNSLLLYFFLLLFANCTSFRTMQVLRVEYQTPVKQYDTSLTILPLTKNYIPEEVLNEYLSHDGNAISLLSRTNEDIYKHYFGLTFSETMTGDIIDLLDTDSISFLEDISFSDTTLALTKNTGLSVMIPQKGNLSTQKNPTDFTLLTQSVFWEIEYVVEQSKLVGGNTTQRIEFTFQLKYVLWDNLKEQVAAYGQIVDRKNLTVVPDRIFYIQLFEEVSRMIVRKSPIQERY